MEVDQYNSGDYTTSELYLNRQNMSFLVWKSFIMITGVRDRDGIPNFIRIPSKNDVETVSFGFFMLLC